ncbi:ABC transporter ATP-binding protein [Oceanobacillus massiliensis]|nr:ABC transporter ATP-binding protein [Oceanobacillus massiliensis]
MKFYKHAANGFKIVLERKITMHTTEETVVSFRRVSKIFNKKIMALQNFDLEVKDGEFISFLGPSGCGKSTALRMVAGLEKASEGEVQVFNEQPKEVISNTNDVAFVFQDANLLPWRNVLDNVVLPLELRGENKQESRDKAIDVLEKVGLKGHLKSYPRQLSGGMKMRVSIARALAAKPKMLLMDEPFGALDEMTRQTLQMDLLHIWEREKTTILFVTHNVYEAALLSSRIAVMTAGPGRLSALIDVDLPRPRELSIRTSNEFMKYVETASNHLENGSIGRELG